MRTEDLIKSVAHRNDEDGVDEPFYTAATMAAGEIFRERPMQKSLTIVHREPELVDGEEKAQTHVGASLLFDGLNASAMAFELTGTASVRFVTDDPDATYKEVTKTYNSPGTFGTFHVFFKDIFGLVGKERCDCAIVFGGNYIYIVRRIGIYRSLLSDNIGDVPVYRKEAAYDLRKLAGDFGSLAQSPVWYDGNDERHLEYSFRVEDGHILLIRHDAVGIYEIRYNAKPPVITEDTVEFDLPPETEDMMVNLTAYYTWLTEDDNLAANYLNMYRNSMTLLKMRGTVNGSPKIVTNGW